MENKSKQKEIINRREHARTSAVSGVQTAPRSAAQSPGAYLLLSFLPKPEKPEDIYQNKMN